MDNGKIKKVAESVDHQLNSMYKDNLLGANEWYMSSATLVLFLKELFGVSGTSISSISDIDFKEENKMDPFDMNRALTEEEKNYLISICTSGILDRFTFRDFWKVLSVFAGIIESVEDSHDE